MGHDTLGWEDAAGWTYAVPDALGSVRQAVDGSGAVLGAREWSPYGVESGDAQPGLGYTGEWWDAAVGLQVLRARWYDAESGRFAATDPWEGSRQQPSTLNRYAYVVGNPVNLVDPTGWYAVEELLALGCGTKLCTVHPIIGYIIGKIQADAASREIQEIYDLNQARYYADAWVACQRMPWWQRLFFCPEHLQTAAGMDTASRIQALAQFGCLVADGRTRPVCGQWDYKVEIGPREDLGRNAQTINFCSIGVKEEVVFYYDIWANVHFGYLGMTGGFEPDMLLTGATLENMGSNLGAVTDDSSDQTCIGIGIHLYETGLTEGALLRQLYAHRDRLNKVRWVGPDQVFEVYQ